jgi:aminopeptidase-like protein
MSESLLKSDINHLGVEMYRMAGELFPICRSITGNGFRQSMQILQKLIPLNIIEIPSGTQVFDWVVPNEWNVRDAYVKNPAGEKVIDFNRSNLHILNYSIPLHGYFSLAELKQHLYSLPETPDWIPYRTSYYAKNWGFCLADRQLQALTEGEYEVFIDASLEPGSLTYGEFVLPGQTSDEVLISCHCCHPSLANDNLSGMVLAAHLARYLQNQPRRYTYRFLFIPGAIGSITWLACNEDKVSHIKHGLVVTCVGDPGKSTYKKSRQGNAEIDRAVQHVLKHSGQEFQVVDFSPYGYDERQYCSPGFNLPVGSLSRTPNGGYPEYHTSADNLDLVQPTFLADSFAKYLAVFDLLENNKFYINLNPKCEPQLGKRGLYGSLGGRKEIKEFEFALLWVLNYSDGYFSLLDIAEKSGINFQIIKEAAEALLNVDLLKPL